MRKQWLCGIGIGVLAVCLTAGAAWGQPVAGVNLGAAVPTSKFGRTVDLGGSGSLFGGYRIKFTENFAVTLLAEPQVATFATDDCDRGDRRCYHDDDDVISIFSFTVGPKFSLLSGPLELFAGAQPGYYRDIVGPLDDDDFGFNVGGGANYELWSGTSLGLFGRYNQTNINAARDSTEDTTFVVAGLSLLHHYLPPPPPPPPQIPPPRVAAPAPAPPPPPVKRKIVLRGVNFDFDKAAIRADARPILDQAIQTLREYGDISIAVQGHTDSIGAEQYNQQLSLRRAESVRTYLTNGGIAAARMTVAGFGESQPVASNDTRDGRAQNRRVELRVLGN